MILINFRIRLLVCYLIGLMPICPSKVWVAVSRHLKVLSLQISSRYRPKIDSFLHDLCQFRAKTKGEAIILLFSSNIAKAFSLHLVLLNGGRINQICNWHFGLRKFFYLLRLFIHLDLTCIQVKYG